MEILLDDFLKAVFKEDIGRGGLYFKIGEKIKVENDILVKEYGDLLGRIYIERLGMRGGI